MNRVKADFAEQCADGDVCDTGGVCAEGTSWMSGNQLVKLAIKVKI